MPVVTAAAISVNGLLPHHEVRVRQAMEREVLKHHAEHGELKDEHADALRDKMLSAHAKHITLINAELEAQRLAAELDHAKAVLDAASAKMRQAQVDADAHEAVLKAASYAIE